METKPTAYSRTRKVNYSSLRKFIVIAFLFAFSANAQDTLKLIGQDLFLSIKYDDPTKIIPWVPNEREFAKMLLSKGSLSNISKQELKIKHQAFLKAFDKNIHEIHQVAADSGLIWNKSVILSVITSFESSNTLDTINKEYKRTISEVYFWSSGLHYSLLFGPVNEIDKKLRLGSSRLILQERKSEVIFRSKEE